jgi:Ca-activated chloride channel family protein
MKGVPMQQAQTAIARGLERLQPGDSFQIIDFSEESSQMGPAPVEASEASIAKGQQYLATLDANGGTYMMKGLRASLDFPHDPRRLRFVAFCTDGFIGNEAEILGELNKRLGSSRVFSFGVGNCNRYLMDSMARMGSGLATYLNLKDNASTVMDNFFDRISHSPMSDLRLDWAGAAVTEVYPSRVPDLFVGRPVILTGRYQGELPSTVRVSGLVGGERRTIEVRTTEADSPLTSKALSQVWARAKLTQVADQSAWDVNNPELSQTAKRVALDYSLMSPFTAFVAVDTAQRTAGDFGTTVAVPVPVPEGTRYDTTVQGAR